MFTFAALALESISCVAFLPQAPTQTEKRENLSFKFPSVVQLVFFREIVWPTEPMN